MDSRLYLNWDETAYNNIKFENYNSNDGYARACEGNLNFSTGAAVSEDEADFAAASYHKKGKIARQDPLSHRIIEKRRRDRMNNCLADLSRLIPPEYLKKGRGRIEKTEIIEMAIKHLKYLKEQAKDPEPREGPISLEQYRLGYQECLSEVMRYLVEHQSNPPFDSVCVQIVHHLQRHCDRIIKSDQLNNPRSNPETTCSSSLSSINYAGDVNQTMIDNVNQVNSIMTENSLTTNGNMNNFASQESKDYRRLSNDNTSNGIMREADSESLITSLQHPSVEYCDRQSVNDRSLQKMPDHVTSSQEFLDFTHRSQNDANKYKDITPIYAQKEQMLRNVRKLTYSVEDLSHSNLDHESAHSYKFKNTIKQRFSESQGHESRPTSPNEHISAYSPSEIKCNQSVTNGKAYKRRRANAIHRDLNRNCDQSLYKNSGTSLSSVENAMNLSQELQNFSRSNDDTNEISQERCKSQNYRASKYSDEDGVPKSRQAPMEKYYKHVPEAKPSGITVPIFALHAKGAFYVPLNIEYECLVPFLGPYDLLSVNGLGSDMSLHPVTISVNFQPSLFVSNKKLHHSKPKVESSDWQ